MNNSRFRNVRAFTILELLVCLGILSVLLSISTPALTDFVHKNEIRQTTKYFLHAINLARSTAITLKEVVTFCKSDDGMQCHGKWNQGSIVFIDYNANAIVNPEDIIIHRINTSISGGNIRWRAFQNKQYIQMIPLGYTNYQNGNFTFCPENKDVTLAQQIVVNRTGRVRIALDMNGDGIREKSNGSPLTC